VVQTPGFDDSNSDSNNDNGDDSTDDSNVIGTAPPPGPDENFGGGIAGGENTEPADEPGGGTQDVADDPVRTDDGTGFTDQEDSDDTGSSPTPSPSQDPAPDRTIVFEDEATNEQGQAIPGDVKGVIDDPETQKSVQRFAEQETLREKARQQIRQDNLQTQTVQQLQQSGAINQDQSQKLQQNIQRRQRRSGQRQSLSEAIGPNPVLQAQQRRRRRQKGADLQPGQRTVFQGRIPLVTPASRAAQRVGTGDDLTRTIQESLGFERTTSQPNIGTTPADLVARAVTGEQSQGVQQSDLGIRDFGERLQRNFIRSETLGQRAQQDEDLMGVVEADVAGQTVPVPEAVAEAGRSVVRGGEGFGSFLSQPGRAVVGTSRAVAEEVSESAQGRRGPLSRAAERSLARRPFGSLVQFATEEALEGGAALATGVSLASASPGRRARGIDGRDIQGEQRIRRQELEAESSLEEEFVPAETTVDASTQQQILQRSGEQQGTGQGESLTIRPGRRPRERAGLGDTEVTQRIQDFEEAQNTPETGSGPEVAQTVSQQEILESFLRRRGEEGAAEILGPTGPLGRQVASRSPDEFEVVQRRRGDQEEPATDASEDDVVRAASELVGESPGADDVVQDGEVRVDLAVRSDDVINRLRDEVESQTGQQTLGETGEGNFVLQRQNDGRIVRARPERALELLETGRFTLQERFLSPRERTRVNQAVQDSPSASQEVMRSINVRETVERQGFEPESSGVQQGLGAFTQEQTFAVEPGRTIRQGRRPGDRAGLGETSVEQSVSDVVDFGDVEPTFDPAELRRARQSTDRGDGGDFAFAGTPELVAAQGVQRGIRGARDFASDLFTRRDIGPDVTRRVAPEAGRVDADIGPQRRAETGRGVGFRGLRDVSEDPLEATDQVTGVDSDFDNAVLEEQGQSVESDVEAALFGETASDSILDQEQSQRQRQEQGLGQDQLLRTRQDTRTRERQRQDMGQGRGQRREGRRGRPSRPGTPGTPDPDDSEDFRGEFSALVKSGGSFREVGRFDTKEAALSASKQVADQTASQSIRVTKDGERLSLEAGGEFRRSESERDTLVERDDSLIDTAGEKQDITLKGLESVR